MKTCRTCRWWTGRTCSNPKLAEWAIRDEDAIDKFPDSALATASDDWGSQFITGPDFGCIHHEAKP
jgi:hypothetical protein